MSSPGLPKVSLPTQKRPLPPAPLVAGVYTYHYDNARTGWNSWETILTPKNAANLQVKFKIQVDGQVYAQPLYLKNFAAGDHSVIYVGTEGGSVWALDAETGNTLWRQSLIGDYESVVPWVDLLGDLGGCSNVAPLIGITSTPVIDMQRNGEGTIFAVCSTKFQGPRDPAPQHFQRLWALDVRTGTPRGSVKIEAKIAGGPTGSIIFNPLDQLQRAGLLLVYYGATPFVYIGFASHCDSHTPAGNNGFYYGWVMAYNVQDPTNLQFAGVINVCPDQGIMKGPSRQGVYSNPPGGGGIWQSGYGLAADVQGNVYFALGNGDVNIPANRPNSTTYVVQDVCHDYGDGILKIGPSGIEELSVLDYFIPNNQNYLNNSDVDLGSGGVMLLPDQSPSSPNQLLVACGKEAKVYLINRAKMGGYNPAPKAGSGPTMAPADYVVQEFMLNKGKPKGVWGGPAYYFTGETQYVYYAGYNDVLKSFVISSQNNPPGSQYTGQVPQLSLSGKESGPTFPNGGTIPVVSSNGMTAGTGIVWAVQRTDRPGSNALYAFDALTLGTIGKWNAGPWENPNGSPFISPIVFDGKVIVGTGGDPTGELVNPPNSTSFRSKENGYVYVFTLNGD